MLVQQFSHVVIHSAADEGAIKIRVDSSSSSKDGLVTPIEDSVSIPMEEHPAISVFWSEKVGVLASVYRDRIPVRIVSTNDCVQS